MVPLPEPLGPPFVLRSVIWTRGKGCGELATALVSDPLRVEGSLDEICRTARAELLVMKKLTSFDLVSVAVPYEVDLAGTTSIVAAVAGGPHSELASIVAYQLANTLGVPVEVLRAMSPEDDRDVVKAGVEALTTVAHGMAYRLVETSEPSDLIDELDTGTLLVAGAPGGSWLQRQFFGQGRRLRNRAPSGTVVVRSSPQRAFHLLREPEAYLSPMLGTGEALRFLEYPVLPVAEDGKLVGVVRRSALLLVGDGFSVASVMEDPVAVGVDTTISEVGEVGAALGGAPVPVVDEDGFLVGVVGP